MDFNIHKYDNVTFHENDLTHKRIKVLLLWFEHEVFTNNLPLELQVELMERWLDRLLTEEYYEVLPFFKILREDMIEKVSNPNHDTISEQLLAKYGSPVNMTPKIDEIIEEQVSMAVVPQKESFLTRLSKKLRTLYRGK